jgi:hypothetical protein
MLALQLVPSVIGASSPAAAAPPQRGTLALRVQDIESKNPIATFKWMISAEHTGGSYGYSGVDGTGAQVQPGAPAYDAAGDPTDATTNCLPAMAPKDLNGNPTGSSNPNFADTCAWPSTRYTPGAVPVVAVGTEADVDPQSHRIANLTLQPGRYLVSVTADGYKIDGGHVTVDGDASVTVELHPYPVPLGNLRAHVFKASSRTWSGSPRT